MDEKSKLQRQELHKIIQSGSVVTWAHVHLQGEYGFSAEKMRDSMGFNTSQILAFKLDEIGKGENRVLIDIPGKSIFSTSLYAKMFNCTHLSLVKSHNSLLMSGFPCLFTFTQTCATSTLKSVGL
jgi:hypothetical protein